MNLKKLRLKLIIMMVILILFCIIALGSFSYLSIKNSLLTTAKDDLKDLIKFNNTKISDWYQTKTNEIENITSNSLISLYDSYYKSQASNILGNYRNIDYIFLVDRNGKLLTNNYARKEKIETAGADIQFEDYNFFQHLNNPSNKEMIYNGVINSPVKANKYLYVFARPILDTSKSDKPIKGIAVMGIKLSHFNEIIKSLKSTEKYTFFITSNNQIVYHDNINMINEDFKNNTTTENKIDEVNFTLNEKEYYGVKTPLKYKNLNLYITTPFKELLAQAYQFRTQLLLGGLVVIFLALIAAYLYGTKLGKRVETISSTTEKVAEGDLTTSLKIEKNDELAKLAQSVNMMIRDLKNIINDISNGSHKINHSSTVLNENINQALRASREVATAVEEVAEGADEQAYSLESITKKTNEMTKNIDTVSNNSQETVDQASQTLTNVEQGNEWMKKLTSQMADIKDKVDSMSIIIKEMDQASSEINQIVELINDIANQTNLLALNAAIEAARAGKSGQGFTVVADEIRGLAEESIDSASKITSLVEKNRTKTKAALNAMNSEKNAVREGEKIVEKTNKIFTKIDQSINHTYTNAKETRQITNKLNQGFVDVLHEIEQTAGIAEEISASSQEMSASAENQVNIMDDMEQSAEELNRLADKMQKLVNKFEK